MIKLSQRLQAIADLIPSGSRVADIGTDHAFLPCYLVQQGISPTVIGIDVKKGPLKSAEQTVRDCQLTDTITLRLGDGLGPLELGEVDTVIIAGMGGNTIKEILNNSLQVVEALQTLILQPMNGANKVRSWLHQHSWQIVDEALLLEDGHYYQIIKGIPGRKSELAEELTAMELSYGPLLIAEKHPLLPELIEKDLLSLQDIKKQLAKSKSVEAKKRLNQLERQAQQMKELKECLSAAMK